MGSCKSKQNINNHNDMDNTYYNATNDDKTNDELTNEERIARETRQIIDCMNRKGNAF